MFVKVIEFSGNTRDANWTYFRSREGQNYFVTYYQNSSRLIHDPKEAWRQIGVAKFTDTGQALKAWCLEMHETYGKEAKEGVADGSFASDTKMIT